MLANAATVHGCSFVSFLLFNLGLYELNDGDCYDYNDKLHSRLDEALQVVSKEVDFMIRFPAA